MDENLETIIIITIIGSAWLIWISVLLSGQWDKFIARLQYRWNTSVIRRSYIAWLVKKKRDWTCEADYVCGYTNPYGFVPEAGCPIHDPIAPNKEE